MRKELETPVIQIVWSVEGGAGRRMMSVTLIELLNDLSFDQFWAQISTGRKLECRSVNHSIMDR